MAAFCALERPLAGTQSTKRRGVISGDRVLTDGVLEADGVQGFVGVDTLIKRLGARRLLRAELGRTGVGSATLTSESVGANRM